MFLSGYLIFHLTGREICSERIHNAQISSYNILPGFSLTIIFNEYTSRLPVYFIIHLFLRNEKRFDIPCMCVCVCVCIA